MSCQNFEIAMKKITHDTNIDHHEIEELFADIDNDHSGNFRMLGNFYEATSTLTNSYSFTLTSSAVSKMTDSGN